MKVFGQANSRGVGGTQCVIERREVASAPGGNEINGLYMNFSGGCLARCLIFMARPYSPPRWVGLFLALVK